MIVKINKHGCSHPSQKKQLRQQNKNVLNIIVLVILVSKLKEFQSHEILCHCMKSVQIRSFSGPNTVKYGPERTPYLGTFHQGFESRWMSVGLICYVSYVTTS